MVQTIATLIDETLMVMGAHLHVRMTDEEKAYLDAHFELIHIKKGEHLVTRGEEVCYLYYLESGIVPLHADLEEFYTLDAEARYKALLANEKWLLRSIPLKDIASYIGITPQALSNIRKRI